MRLLTPPWKTAWYDDHLSERFFQEMARTELDHTRKPETSAQWMDQLVIEFGQLAQNMIHLEHPSPQPAQIRMAFEKALKLSVLACHLTASLDRADPGQNHTPVVQPQKKMPQPTPGGSAPQTAGSQPRPAAPLAANPPQGAGGHPMRETILSLSRRGLSVAEIEMITGQRGIVIEKTLGRG